jgi:hypothetical protein
MGFTAHYFAQFWLMALKKTKQCKISKCLQYKYCYYLSNIIVTCVTTEILSVSGDKLLIYRQVLHHLADHQVKILRNCLVLLSSSCRHRAKEVTTLPRQES